ncbi:single-stranded DNA-binding protein [Arthrobacter sp. Leaf69]|uniref:single-stranded DNA-binding protein n=1 Tax=Arthrobacter sp. Leaf69 TaxID=1736232 RepID=UPI0007018CD8|nr:single-stranded DNA-binding protein [Arthrobacter sp. Leaf69]KQN88766.1 single-stranded DNA-binding protein [Arthrobacter sp. Leaf69]
MSDNITVRGFVATEIKSSTTPGGVATASFRLGSTDRRYDRATGAWIDGNTNWFTVQGYRQLAGNIGCSIKKGQRVIVMGRLKMRSWENDGRIYHVAEIAAESVGHDLMWGSANFIRTATNGPQDAAGHSGSSPAFPDGGREGSDEDDQARAGHHGDNDTNNDDDADDNDASGSHTVFINDASGEAEELDQETGELKGAAA